MGKIPCMTSLHSPANTIRTALETVADLRAARSHDPALGQTVARLKAFQGLRFAHTYADLLQDPVYQPAARFFLDELYSERDYAERDTQFARIAGALQKFFPSQVVHTAVLLAGLHALTEELDQSMALAWLAQETPGLPISMRYLEAWRTVGCRNDRTQQLNTVLHIGKELDLLTRKTGLRTMLRMMRGPAEAAGMGALQKFLEAGFDTFAAMARTRQGTQTFLNLVADRESAWIATLFDAPAGTAQALLARTPDPATSQ